MEIVAGNGMVELTNSPTLAVAIGWWNEIGVRDSVADGENCSVALVQQVQTAQKHSLALDMNHLVVQALPLIRCYADVVVECRQQTCDAFAVDIVLWTDIVVALLFRILELFFCR